MSTYGSGWHHMSLRELRSREEIESWSKWRAAQRQDLQHKNEIWLKIVKDWIAVLVPFGVVVVSLLAMLEVVPWPNDFRPSYVFYSMTLFMAGSHTGSLKRALARPFDS